MNKKLSVSVKVRDDDMEGIHLGNTRVPMERVIIEFLHGETPEQIVANFNSLTLADVYTVITEHGMRQPRAGGYI